jgi:hypothetical protein
MQRSGGDERTWRSFRPETRAEKRALGRRNRHSAQLPDDANRVGGGHEVTLQCSDRSLGY